MKKFLLHLFILTIIGFIPKAEGQTYKKLSDARICSGHQYEFDATVTSGENVSSYKWVENTNDGAKFSTASSGDHKVVINFEGNPIPVEKTVNLVVDNITIQLPSQVQNVYCSTENEIEPTISFTGNLKPNEVTYQWQMRVEGSSSWNDIPAPRGTTLNFFAKQTDGNGKFVEYRLMSTPTVIYTDGVTCTKKSENISKVRFPEDPIFNGFEDKTICSGSKLVLSVEGHYTNIKWFKNGSQLSSFNNKKVLNLNGLGPDEAGSKYSVEVTANSTCSYSKDVEIIVLEKPDISVIADKQVCTTDASVSVELKNAVAGNSYIFELIKSGSTIQTKPATPGANGSYILNFDPVSEGNYEIRVTNSKNGIDCDDISSNFVIHPKQGVSISSSETDKEVCEGTSIILTANLIDGGNTSDVVYKWYKLPNTTNVIHTGKELKNLDTPDESGDYKVVISQNGCTAESTINGILINPKAEFIVANSSFCKGVVDVNVTNFHNGLSYKYELLKNDGTTLIDSKTINNSSSNPVSLSFGSNTGNLKVRVTVDGDNNCDTFDDVVVYENIEASVSRDRNDVCEGSNIKLTATFTPNYPGSYSRKYTWYDSSNNIVQTGSSNTLIRKKYSQTDNYYVKVEIDGCDDYSNPIDVNIKPKAKFTINNDQLCGGSVSYTNYDNFKVKNSDIIAGLNYKYDLINPDNSITNLGNFSDGTVPSFTISPLNPNIDNKYKLRISVEGACPTTKTFTVYKNPTVTINDGGYYPRCENDGSYHRLKAIVSSRTGVAKYEWEKDGSPFGGNNQRIYPTTVLESGTYKVKVTLVNGCTINSEPITIKINPVPKFDSQDAVICQGGSVNLKAQNIISADPGDYIYSWTGPGAPYGNTDNIDVNQPGTYSLTISNSFGCPSDVKDFIVTEEDVQITPTGLICSNNGVAMLTANVNGQNPHNYRWTFNGTPIGGNSNTLSITQDGTYSVTVDTDNCTLIDTQTITIIPDLENDINIDLSSNPVCLTSVGQQATITANINWGTVNPSSYNLKYEWSGPQVDSQDNSVPSAIVGLAGTYRLQIVFVDADGNEVLCSNNWAEITINESIVTLSESGSCGDKTITSNIIGDWEVDYKDGNGYNSTGDNNVYEITVSTSGKYRITEGSCGGQKEIDVIVHPYPTVTIDQAKPYSSCSSDANLTATVTSVDPITSVTPSQWQQIGTSNQYEYIGTLVDGDTYSITVETANGCSDTDNITPVIYEAPEIDLANLDFCEGDQVDLYINNPEASVTYEWFRIIKFFGYEIETPLNPDENSKINAINPKTEGTYVFRIKATDSSKPASCNTNTETFDVNIHPIPIVDLDDDHIVCTSSNYELDAENNGAFYQWWYNGVLTTSNSQKYLANKAGSYRVEVTNFGCSAFDEVTIFRTNDNNFFGLDRTLCIGDAITLDANALISVPNVEFTWEFIDDATSNKSTILNGVGSGFEKLVLNNLQISNSGQYILTAHDPYTGCDYTEDFTLKVIDIDAIDIDPQYAKCSNSDLEISINNPIPQVIYTWEVIGLDGITLIHSETTTGSQTFKFDNSWNLDYTYRVSAKLPKGCASSPVIFDIYNGFVADFELQLNLKDCNDDTNISALLTDPSMEAVTWQWFQKVNGNWEQYDSPILSTSPKVITISPETTDNTLYFMLKAISKDGCSTEKIIDVPNIKPSTLGLEDEIYLCEGEVYSVDFTVNQAKSYLVNNVTINPDANGRYIFDITDIGNFVFEVETKDNCWVIDEINAKKDLLEIADINDLEACIGVDVSPTVTETNGKAYGYQWYIDGVLQTDDNGFPINTPTLNYTITDKDVLAHVVVETEHGCPVQSNDFILKPKEVPGFVLPDMEVCDGGSIKFDATPIDPTVVVIPNGYSWFFEGNQIAGAKDATYTIDEASYSNEGEYYAIIQTSAGCNYKQVFGLQINKTPFFTFDDDYTGCLENNPLLNINLSAYTDDEQTDNVDNYLWEVDYDRDGTFEVLKGVNESSYTVKKKGIYRATVTTKSELGGCDYSQEVDVNFELVPKIVINSDPSDCTPTRPFLRAEVTNDDFIDKYGYIYETNNNGISSYQWKYKKNKDDEYLTDLGTNFNQEVNKDGWYQVIVTPIDSYDKDNHIHCPCRKNQ